MLDPDHFSTNPLEPLLREIEQAKPTVVLIGGSLISIPLTQQVILLCKEKLSMPIYLFPGSASQVYPGADGILFLSLLSGRNPEFLIGQHVHAAPLIKHYDLEVLPTGYILIDGGMPTSVSYMSNTQPIPANKSDIAAATALAGEYLGMGAIYIESGSGADRSAPLALIEHVRKEISIPLMVGGGITSTTRIHELWEAGADLVVIGTAIEKEEKFLKALNQLKKI